MFSVALLYKNILKYFVSIAIGIRIKRCFVRYCLKIMVFKMLAKDIWLV